MRSDQDSPVLDPCPDSCWTGFYVGNQDDPIVQVLLDSGNPALLTGDIVCGGFFQGCYLYITGAYNVPCTKIVPAETHSWGALKSRY